MRMPPLLADFSHARACKPFCEKGLQTILRKILDTTPNLCYDRSASLALLSFRGEISMTGRIKNHVS